MMTLIKTRRLFDGERVRNEPSVTIVIDGDRVRDFGRTVNGKNSPKMRARSMRHR